MKTKSVKEGEGREPAATHTALCQMMNVDAACSWMITSTRYKGSVELQCIQSKANAERLTKLHSATHGEKDIPDDGAELATTE